MKKIAFLFLINLSVSAQIVLSSLGGTSTGGGGGGTVTGSSNSTASAVSTITSGAQTTTAGDNLFVYSSADFPCSSYITSGVGLLPTDTGGDTFTPVIPLASIPIGIQITNAGTGYTTAPTCTLSNGGTCSIGVSGGSMVSINVVTPGTPGASAATVSISGVGTSAAAIVSAYGIATDLKCGAAWISTNIAGTTNNQVTTTMSGTFNGVSVAERTMGAPKSQDASAVASAVSLTSVSSITSSAFTTAVANETMFCGSRIEGLSGTWTAGSGYTLVTGAIPSGANNFQAVEYQTFTSIQTAATASISTSLSGTMNIICSPFEGT